MYASELELRVRYEELRREADRHRLAREAARAPRATARSGEDEPGGRVSAGRGRRWGRVRRAAA
ncbi:MULTISPECIES: hypothetical protein [unclassified Streptomyces]|uniref:hypothetical protein n=1 Tax=unclassified Streptomyces TaxID=2593676 RepID=UPI000374AC33|nr:MULTISPECIES: hypothetical protein [unclassified Streptomyces]MYT28430.1 hypothetical protein [Streptomyces sp. SID8354]